MEKEQKQELGWREHVHLLGWTRNMTVINMLA